MRNHSAVSLPLILLILFLGACTLYGGAGEIDPDDDRSIERGIHAELRDSAVRGATSLGVEVEDGVVTLEGSIQDPAGIGDIVMRVESLAGVRRVISEIEFDGSEREEQPPPTEEPPPTQQQPQEPVERQE